MHTNLRFHVSAIALFNIASLAASQPDYHGKPSTLRPSHRPNPRLSVPFQATKDVDIFVYKNKYNFMITDFEMPFDDALQYCRAKFDDAHLAIIENQDQVRVASVF